MSAQTAYSSLALFYATVVQGQYSNAAAGAFTIYDWLASIPTEIELFWGNTARPLSIALYYTTRYTTLLQQILMVLNFSLSDELHCACRYYQCARIFVIGPPSV
ncbi:hypothetical protein BD311DRAFT_478370 [Dichomitus squalens]|uniref:DUF6533 domain-containing protein n=1 Tax=Dichomitus squalens TaxID=114155 RepID=A0A4Q9N2I9_9APHY|nr:hypothetical protein BD311DRAFT_478370 [Dichomitus squalens]